MEKKEIAYKIVDGIVDDLNDRNGIGIDDLDDEIKEEIFKKWIEIVLKFI